MRPLILSLKSATSALILSAESPFDAGMLYDKCSNEWLVTHYITYAEDASDEVASFFQVMTMSTTRRLPAKKCQRSGRHMYAIWSFSP